MVKCRHKYTKISDVKVVYNCLDPNQLTENNNLCIIIFFTKQVDARSKFITL